MPAGTWSFLHESVIYEYMMERAKEKQLKLKARIMNGEVVLKERWFKVGDLREIRDTTFPDIKNISMLRDPKGSRTAEIKFLTTSFDYHKDKKYICDFENFKKNNGCIIVARHNELPDHLVQAYKNIDIFEIDYIDFISFAKENFTRFFNRQIKAHDYKKVWLFIQSPNFNKGTHIVKPARLSGIWCPSENLSGFDLAVGDKVIFVKVKGANKQTVNKTYQNGTILEKWLLQELWIGTVNMPIQSRHEYCQTKKIDLHSPLWYDETEEGKNDKRVTQRKSTGIRWKRVFGYKEDSVLRNLNISFKELEYEFKDFVKAVVDIYVRNVSREIRMDQYVSLIEHISEIVNEKKEQLVYMLPDTFDVEDSHPPENLLH